MVPWFDAREGKGFPNALLESEAKRQKPRAERVALTHG
jgi:hypothetical protein